MSVRLSWFSHPAKKKIILKQELYIGKIFPNHWIWGHTTYLSTLLSKNKTLHIFEAKHLYVTCTGSVFLVENICALDIRYRKQKMRFENDILTQKDKKSLRPSLDLVAAFQQWQKVPIDVVRRVEHRKVELTWRNPLGVYHGRSQTRGDGTSMRSGWWREKRDLLSRVSRRLAPFDDIYTEMSFSFFSFLFCLFVCYCSSWTGVICAQ